MSLTDDQIEAKNFQKFYNAILPYLNGSAHSGFTPIGTVISVMGTTAPLNYLACDGTAYNISDYPELAAYFNQQFGSSNFFGGDGTTTFAVPDLRGEFLRGTGTNSHANQGSGANVGVHQDATEIPNIFVNGNNNMIGIENMSTSFLGMNKMDSRLRSNVIGKGKQATLSDEWNSSSYNVSTSRPTNTSVLYCIASKNIFMDAGSNYSTEEQVVGTWIDGKPIYQKTVTGAFSSTINTWVEGVALGTDCIIQCVTGAVAINDNFEESIPYPGDCVYLINSINGSTKKYGSVGVRAEHSSWVNKSFRMTLQYTKTTD